MQKISIRWMIRSDMKDVYKLQNDLQFPLTEGQFDTCLMRHNAIGMIAEYDGDFMGYMIYDLYKTHFHIYNLAVGLEYRRKKVGTQLIELLRNRLSKQKRTFLSVNVRETDLGSQLFFKNLGFRAKLVRDFYENEDSYWFCCKMRT